MLSVLINTHLLWPRATPASSASSTPRPPASTPPTSRPTPRIPASRRADAYPAMPEDGYGWEKLFSERMCRHFREDFGLRDPRRPLPQRLRPARHLERRPREGAGGDLPQGRRGEAHRATTRSRSGATASRPAASCTSTTASRAPRRSCSRDILEPINLGSERAGHDQRAGRHRRGHRRRQARAPLRPLRAEGRPRPQQRQHADPASARLGADASRCAKGSSRPTPGSSSRSRGVEPPPAGAAGPLEAPRRSALRTLRG